MSCSKQVDSPTFNTGCVTWASACSHRTITSINPWIQLEMVENINYKLKNTKYALFSLNFITFMSN